MEKIREKKFWCSNLLPKLDKSSIKHYTFQQYLLWFFSLIVLILLGTTSVSHPEFICKNYWSWYTKLSYDVFFLFYAIWGYYIGNANEAYYTYAILHCHFQAKIISAYIKREFKHYENVPFKNKIYSKAYQNEVKKILEISIQQYQCLRRFYCLTKATNVL